MTNRGKEDWKTYFPISQYHVDEQQHSFPSLNKHTYFGHHPRARKVLDRPEFLKLIRQKTRGNRMQCSKRRSKVRATARSAAHTMYYVRLSSCRRQHGRSRSLADCTRYVVVVGEHCNVPRYSTTRQCVYPSDRPCCMELQCTSNYYLPQHLPKHQVRWVAYG